MTDMIGIMLLPFWGTALGSLLVFLPGRLQSRSAERILTGFAAGVMVAASIWSLIIPALEQTEALGKWSFLPAVTGIWAGFGFLLLLDHLLPHIHRTGQIEGLPSRLGSTAMLVLAVTLHNLPEGIAVGTAAAGFRMGEGSVSFSALLSLSIGIALQNIPEGAIISLPLHSTGMSRRRSFGIGILSGVVEPVGSILTLLMASIMAPILPVLLCFAAGAMLYVVAESLIPEMQDGRHSDMGIIAFCAGFTVMMGLDVALG